MTRVEYMSSMRTLEMARLGKILGSRPDEVGEQSTAMCRVAELHALLACSAEC